MSIIHLEQPDGIVSEPTGSPKIVPATGDLSGNMFATLGTTLDEVNDSITTYDKCSYVNLSASALVKTGAGQVYGVIINSHTAGTLKLWDNTSAATTVLCNTMTFAVGERFIPLYGMTFGTGLYATISGTLDCTLAYR